MSAANFSIPCMPPWRRLLGKESNNQILSIAPIVEWIQQWPPKLQVQVRFLLGAHKKPADWRVCD